MQNRKEYMLTYDMCSNDVYLQYTSVRYHVHAFSLLVLT